MDVHTCIFICVCMYVHNYVTYTHMAVCLSVIVKFSYTLPLISCVIILLSYCTSCCIHVYQHAQARSNAMETVQSVNFPIYPIYHELYKKITVTHKNSEGMKCLVGMGIDFGYEYR